MLGPMLPSYPSDYHTPYGDKVIAILTTVWWSTDEEQLKRSPFGNYFQAKRMCGQNRYHRCFTDRNI